MFSSCFFPRVWYNTRMENEKMSFEDYREIVICESPYGWEDFEIENFYEWGWSVDDVINHGEDKMDFAIFGEEY